jgi:hypothetical protein
MIDFEGWPTTAAGLIAALAAGIRTDRLLRLYVRNRMATNSEQRRRAHSALQTKSLVRLAGRRLTTIRVIERNADGYRSIEINGSDRPDRRTA